MRKLLMACLVAFGLAVVVWAADGPLTPIANLKGRTDGNGYLLVSGGTFAGADGPLTPIGQLRGRTDSNGYLRVALAGGSITSPLLAGDGTCTAPSYAFSAQPGLGEYRAGTNIIGYCGDAYSTTLPFLAYVAGASIPQVVMSSTTLLQWSSTTTALGSTGLSLGEDAANTLALKNGANAQSQRWYFTTTGPVYTSLTARTAGAVVTAAGGAMQLSTSQTTVPTCSANCGTSPSVVGTDTAGIVTMGATGVPASGWVVTFNGTWPAAPSCNVIPALAGMAAGKAPIVVATTVTTITVTTNGVAPATSDKYAYQCIGVS